MRLTVVSVWVRCVMVSVPQVEHLQAAALHDPTEPLYCTTCTWQACWPTWASWLTHNVMRKTPSIAIHKIRLHTCSWRLCWHHSCSMPELPPTPLSKPCAGSCTKRLLWPMTWTPTTLAHACGSRCLAWTSPGSQLRMCWGGQLATGNEQPMPCTSCVSLPWVVVVVVVVVCGLLTEGRGSACRLVQCAQLATHRIAADSSG